MTMASFDYTMRLGVAGWAFGSPSTLYNAVKSDKTLGKAVNTIREVLDVVALFSKKMGLPIAVTSAFVGIGADLGNIRDIWGS